MDSNSELLGVKGLVKTMAGNLGGKCLVLLLPVVCTAAREKDAFITKALKHGSSGKQEVNVF